MLNPKTLKKKRDAIAFLIGISTLNHIDNRLRGVDEKKANEQYAKEIDMLVKEYEKLIKSIVNETRMQSEEN